jgi:hypothetical protein
VSRVATSWRHTPSVYGPFFNGISAVGAVGYRESPTLARVFYQCLAGAALVGAVVLMIVRRIPTWAIALVALGPITIATVNGAHNDLIVGLGILVGLWLLAEGHPRWAGATIALASLVKLLGVPAAAGAVVALLLARRWKEAIELAVSFAVVVGVGYLLAGGPAALHPLSKASENLSSGSIMAGVAWFIRHPLGSPHIGPLAHPAQRSQLAAVAAVVLFGLFAFRQRHRPDPAVLACGALLIYLLTAPYALPWYAAALILPAALATPRLRWLCLAALVALQAGHISSAGLQHAYVPFALYGARLAACADALVLIVLLVGVGRPDAPHPDRPDDGPASAAAAA